VELFPTQIRRASMVHPLPLGNGWFGGSLPLIAITASTWATTTFGTGTIYTGLIYPIFVFVVTWIAAVVSSTRPGITASTPTSTRRDQD
jgi:hypothetical protein